MDNKVIDYKPEVDCVCGSRGVYVIIPRPRHDPVEVCAECREHLVSDRYDSGYSDYGRNDF